MSKLKHVFECVSKGEVALKEELEIGKRYLANEVFSVTNEEGKTIYYISIVNEKGETNLYNRDLFKYCFSFNSSDELESQLYLDYPLNNIPETCHVIAMEELSELQKAISKAYRGKLDRDNLIEEIADVEICIKFMKTIYNITTQEVNDIKHEKIKRIETKVLKGEFK